jgi:NitT/TauT family transport system substrate-binding protein
VQLAARGVDINVLYVADAVDLVANGIITNEATIAENPDLVQGFVRAVVRGLEDTLADPAAAFVISKNFVEGLEDDRLAVLNASLPLWEADPLGITTASSWEQTAQVLLEAGLLDGPVPDLSAAYSNEFIRAVQP